MEKKVKEKYVELKMRELNITHPILKEVVKEMLLSEDYDVQRFEGMLMGVTPFVHAEHISLDTIKKMLLEYKTDFVPSTVRIESINNLRGYVNIRYKTSMDKSWEDCNTIYFHDMIKFDENFKKFMEE